MEIYYYVKNLYNNQKSQQILQSIVHILYISWNKGCWKGEMLLIEIKF